MAKNRWWLSLLVGILILVVLAGAGYAVYRLGYAHGQEASAGGQLTPRAFQGQPNIRNPNLGLRAFGRGIIPFTRAGGVLGLPWPGVLAGLVIFVLVIVVLVLLIIYLLGKLGSKRTLQKVPVETNTVSSDQEYRQV